MNAIPNTIDRFCTELAGQIRQVESLLPPGIDVKRFMRTAVNAISTHSQADKLLDADRQSLFNACQKAAGDGLLIDGREATLVVFRDKRLDMEVVSYIPMVQGMVKLARNSGEISNLIAEVVYSKDLFKYRPAHDPHPLHQPDWFGDRGEPVGAYAVVTLKDGEKITTVLPGERILAIGQGGRNADQYIPGKGAHYGEWWRKTVIKNVLKYAPKSSQLESALEADNEGFDPDAVPVVEASRVTRLRDRLGKKLPVRTASNPPPGRGETDRSRDPDQDTFIPMDKGPDSDDQVGLAVTLEAIGKCQTQDQLDEVMGEMVPLVHPDLVEQVEVAARDRALEIVAATETGG